MLNEYKFRSLSNIFPLTSFAKRFTIGIDMDLNMPLIVKHEDNITRCK